MTRERSEELLRLLRTRDVIDILIGDTELSGGLKLPYLSGPKIVELSNELGCPATYQSSGGQSRWMYMQDLLDSCLARGMASNLLATIFSKQRLSSVLSTTSAAQADIDYHATVGAAIDAINAVLYAGNVELVAAGPNFVVRDRSEGSAVVTPMLKKVDAAYLRDLAIRANEDIARGELDSALTKARTILEETFCYVIERKGETPSDKGDITELYKQVKGLYNMHGNKEFDKRFNTLLSGLEKVVSSITQMRNESSDAHGGGQRRLPIRDYHARLAVNSAAAMGEFVLSVSDNAVRQSLTGK